MGPFAASKRLSKSGDLVVVATPGAPIQADDIPVHADLARHSDPNGDFITPNECNVRGQAGLIIRFPRDRRAVRRRTGCES